MDDQLEIIVFGAKQICASCVGMPSSIDTYEWLEAALSRKYPQQPFKMTYVDIFNPPEEHVSFANRVVNDEFFYPVVVIKDEVVGEGNPKLRQIYKIMEAHGYRAK